jgi:CHAT domain-containing protein
VIAPIQKLLGKTRHVYLSPDGALSLVPFGALIDSDEHYVAETMSITYLMSGRDVVRMGNRTSQQPPAVFAAPNYGISSPNASRHFAPLQAGSGEGLDVWDKLPNAKFYDGDRATEQRLKALHGPSVLHISTHRFFDKNLAALHEPSHDASFDMRPSPPVENALLRSGIAFAGANHGGTEGEDGLLTALEASQLDLWGTKLVVLSACETGMGQAENGDGVYGLRRAFAMAGAEAVVMSLWQVDANATTDMMKSYYQGLSGGGGRAEALRQVQLAMLSRRDTAHPHYWASFIVSGDDRSIEGRPVEPTFGRITRGGCGGACAIGTHETTGDAVWHGVLLSGALIGLRRRATGSSEARTRIRRS